MNITLLGKVPPKKNSKRWIVRGGQKFLIPSEQHATWHKDVCTQLRQQRPQAIVGPVSLLCTFYMGDNRKRDLDGALASILDVLVDNRLIEDDCWQIVQRITVVSAGVDKENPRVDIVVSPISDPQ